jgi:hypothetical protein
MQEDVPRSESKEQAERRPNRTRVSVPTRCPACLDSSHRGWGQGTVKITLQPGRKNLLRIDYSLL